MTIKYEKRDGVAYITLANPNGPASRSRTGGVACGTIVAESPPGTSRRSRPSAVESFVSTSKRPTWHLTFNRLTLQAFPMPFEQWSIFDQPGVDLVWPNGYGKPIRPPADTTRSSSTEWTGVKQSRSWSRCQ